MITRKKDEIKREPVIIEEPVTEIEAENTTIKEKEIPLMRGMEVIFTGTKTYSGLDISQYSNKKYKVKEISDDRVVLSEKAEVVAAVNIKDCKRV